MSRFKTAVVNVALIALAFWPIVHINLVKAYDLNAWKLAGWGMYAAPQLPCAVRIVGLTPDEVREYELGTIPPDLEPAVNGFLRHRRVLRRLVAPDRLARKLLGYYPRIDGVRIVVEQPFLDPRTGTIGETSTAYEYLRDTVD